LKLTSAKKADWPSHKLLCAAFATFDKSTRPSSLHTLGILFPDDAGDPNPRLVWIGYKVGLDVLVPGLLVLLLGRLFHFHFFPRFTNHLTFTILVQRRHIPPPSRHVPIGRRPGSAHRPNGKPARPWNLQRAHRAPAHREQSARRAHGHAVIPRGHPASVLLRERRSQCQLAQPRGSIRSVRERLCGHV
jgi:hypothetical protein